MNDINLMYRNFKSEFGGVEQIITPDELKSLFNYVSNMEGTLTQLKDELAVMQDKLDKSDNSSLIKVDFAKKKEDLLEQCKLGIQEIKTSILDGASEIKDCVQQKNIEGLNAVLQKLHIKELCVKMESLMEKGKDKVLDLWSKSIYTGYELGQAKGHINNAQRGHEDGNSVEFEPIEFKRKNKCFEKAWDTMDKGKTKSACMAEKLDKLNEAVECHKNNPNREIKSYIHQTGNVTKQMQIGI